MAFAIANIVQFFANHPEFRVFSTLILKKADENQQGGMISGVHLRPVMGRFSSPFLDELMQTPKHIMLAFTQKAQVSPDLVGQLLMLFAYKKKLIYYGHAFPPPVAIISETISILDVFNSPNYGRFQVDSNNGLGKIYINDLQNSDDDIYFENLIVPTFPGEVSRMQGHSGLTGRLNPWRCILYKIPPPK
jgi:hypothetical protein